MEHLECRTRAPDVVAIRTTGSERTQETKRGTQPFAAPQHQRPHLAEEHRGFRIFRGPSKFLRIDEGSQFCLDLAGQLSDERGNVSL